MIDANYTSLILLINVGNGNGLGGRCLPNRAFDDRRGGRTALVARLPRVGSGASGVRASARAIATGEGGRRATTGTWEGGCLRQCHSRRDCRQSLLVTRPRQLAVATIIVNGADR